MITAPGQTIDHDAAHDDPPPIEIGRGRWIDEALRWLADKPLPEEAADQGDTLGDVVAIVPVGRRWQIHLCGFGEAELIDEVDDAVQIFEDIAAGIDHEDDPSHRPTLAAMRRISDALHDIGPVW